MNKETEKIINSLEDVAKRNYIIVEDSRVSSVIYQPSREATLYVNFHTANLLLDYIESKDKEIERLDNIIDELEKFMNEDYEYYKKYGYAEQGHAMGEIRRIKNKLQELKGEDKE